MLDAIVPTTSLPCRDEEVGIRGMRRNPFDLGLTDGMGY
jgi:hypothetical protein